MMFRSITERLLIENKRRLRINTTPIIGNKEENGFWYSDQNVNAIKIGNKLMNNSQDNIKQISKWEDRDDMENINNLLNALGGNGRTNMLFSRCVFNGQNSLINCNCCRLSMEKCYLEMKIMNIYKPLSGNYIFIAYKQQIVFYIQIIVTYFKTNPQI